jgi:hypothetical protein
MIFSSADVAAGWACSPGAIAIGEGLYRLLLCLATFLAGLGTSEWVRSRVERKRAEQASKDAELAARIGERLAMGRTESSGPAAAAPSHDREPPPG